MIAAPPLVPGAPRVKVTVPAEMVELAMLGAEGVVAGVTGPNSLDAAPAPIELIARAFTQ